MSYYHIERIVSGILDLFSSSRDSMIYNSVLIEITESFGFCFLFHKSHNLLEVYTVNPSHDFEAGTIPFPHYDYAFFDFNNNLTFYQEYKSE